MGAEEVWQNVETPDGRSLEVVSQGPADALLLVFHGGTPVAAVLHPPMVDAAIASGLRFITYSRPGYATSDAMPGRSVADAVTDVTAILDVLGADRFVTIGWSGGGPHALACGALLASRCAAVATIAAVAPYPAEGIDWLAGMGEENVEEFGAALEGEDALSTYLKEEAIGLSQVTATDLDDALGDLVSEVDRASLTGPFAEWAAASFRKAVSTGIAGWRDDDLAFVKPWGFDLTSLTRPVALWQGSDDRMVPSSHGKWLAAHVPTAHPRLLEGEGHLSVGVGAFGRIVEDLVRLAKEHA
jgi:pimeloyl-ACP methyl ester carboxylesterase